MKKFLFTIAILSLLFFTGCSNNNQTLHEVSFNSMGGSAVESVFVEEGGFVPIPEVEKEDYTLEGWYTSLNEGQTLDEKWSFTTNTVNSNITLYAKWRINQYKFSILDYDESIIYEETYDYNANLSGLAISDPIREGYTFVGWDRVIPTTMPSNDVTIKAQYSINQYTISFNSNEGSDVISITQDYDTVVIEPQEPTKEGYTFIGWFSDEELTIEYTFPTMPAEDITLYAKWSETLETHLYTYAIDGNEVIIIGYLGYEKNLTIPNQIGGYSVTTIGDSAFYHNSLTSVTIPDSVTTIGDYAFSWNDLTSVTIPDSVTTIGDDAFSSNSLTSITIPDSVTTIGDSAFYDNSLTSITIPDSVTTIGDAAFESNYLTSVIIGSSVITIGDYAFSWNDLTSVTISDSVTTIGERAFDWREINNFNVGNNPNFIHEDNLLLSADRKTVIAGIGELTSVIIPNTVTTIGDSAFYYNSLTNVTIPDSVTKIGDFAFSWNDLTSVTVPDSVTKIGDFAFYWREITNFSIGNNPNFIYENNLLLSADEKTLIAGIGDLTDVTIPNTVITIRTFAFYYNSLTSVTLGSSVTTIGNFAFYHNSLTSVAIPDSVTTIGDDAFSWNDLTSVTIPDSVTTIGDFAFSWNDLTSVTILGEETRFNDQWAYIGFPENLKPQ